MLRRGDFSMVFFFFFFDIMFGSNPSEPQTNVQSVPRYTVFNWNNSTHFGTSGTTDIRRKLFLNTNAVLWVQIFFATL